MIRGQLNWFGEQILVPDGWLREPSDTKLSPIQSPLQDVRATPIKKT